MPKTKATTRDSGYSESDDYVPDPTAMTGTLDTSDTSGRHTSAADVSDVFDAADAAARAHPAPEGALGQDPDPEATGEHALDVDYAPDQERLARQEDVATARGDQPSTRSAKTKADTPAKKAEPTSRSKAEPATKS